MTPAESLPRRSSQAGRLEALGRVAPLSRDSMPGLVAARLRTAIVDGSFPPGMQLAEIPLAERLGVSRGPLREALQRLIQEGLLRGERHRGVFVPALDNADVIDVYRMREFLEGAAATWLVRGEGGAWQGPINAAIERLRRAIRSGRWSRVVEADLGFHSTLVDSVESTRLSRAFQTLVAESRLCLHRLEAFYPDPRDVLPEHEAIAAAIRDRKADRVMRLVADHMHESVTRLTLHNAPVHVHDLSQGASRSPRRPRLQRNPSALSEPPGEPSRSQDSSSPGRG